MSPGAFGSILFQLQGNRLNVGTVSDRTSDYDAVRPDVWTHLAFGRGYGSYDHVSYRILDSEILSRIVDTGILGLLFYLLMIVSFVLAARALIRSRHPVWSPPALTVAASAVAFLVVSFLFDVTSFPHTPYIMFSLAGLLAAILGSRHSEPEPPPPEVRRPSELFDFDERLLREPAVARAVELPLRS
jgi:O-antigen ligase